MYRYILWKLPFSVTNSYRDFWDVKRPIYVIFLTCTSRPLRWISGLWQWQSFADRPFFNDASLPMLISSESWSDFALLPSCDTKFWPQIWPQVPFKQKSVLTNRSHSQGDQIERISWIVNDKSVDAYVYVHKCM
jgi:hypothetical protein